MRCTERYGSAGAGAPAKTRSQAEKIEAQLAALDELSYRELRAEWLRWYQIEPPARLSRHLLLLGVGWKIQEWAYGGLSTAAKRRLATLAKTLDQGGQIRPDPKRRLRPGARLVREWHGRTHTVTVVEGGFEWQGKVWRSLSSVAREITGQRWSGPRFFGLLSAPAAADFRPLIGDDKASTND